MAEPTYPTRTIATLLDLTERRVRQLADEGIIPKGKNGRYALVACVQGYVRHLRTKLAGGTEGIEQQRVRLLTARARRAELENHRLEGELITVADVERGWTYLVSATRSRILGLPTRLAAELAALDDPGAVKARLEEELYGALQELSNEEEPEG